MPLICTKSINKLNRNVQLKPKKIVDTETNDAIEALLDTGKKYIKDPSLTSDIDLVYIVRRGQMNIDLRYSLRSVTKFCNYRNIWIVGFKPDWVQNVKYIPTEQNADKWKNSIINYKAACKAPGISENFVLMNDDFFAIRPITDWNYETNVCLGRLEEFVTKFSSIAKKSKWQWGFTYAVELLSELAIASSWNYEAHTPMMINKQNFLKMLSLPKIQRFQETKKVLHKRSLYKNLYPDANNPRYISDVKLPLHKDLTLEYLKENWISTYDNTLRNPSFPLINKLLLKMFDRPCKYEKRF
jgi:hypothetical protein